MQTHYEAVTAADVTIRTFESRDMAMSWWAVEADRFPGCSIQAVTETRMITRRTLRRDRSDAPTNPYRRTA